MSDQDVQQALNRPAGRPVPGRRPDTMCIRGYAGHRGVLKVIMSAADPKLVVSVMWEEGTP